MLKQFVVFTRIITHINVNVTLPVLVLSGSKFLVTAWQTAMDEMKLRDVEVHLRNTSPQTMSPLSSSNWSRM